ncbi:MAG: hypothetical protein GQ525_02800 [Draconibacterium sp.]|nr:hypothetical protein [Draconibacterium sp.]
MQRRKINKLDNTGIGLLAGFITPVIIFFAVYFIRESGISFSNYVGNLMYLQSLVKLGSLCVFANSAVFMGFIKLKYEKTARGVLAATIIYAFVVLISRAF